MARVIGGGASIHSFLYWRQHGAQAVNAHRKARFDRTQRDLQRLGDFLQAEFLVKP
jgi:hypothetical protein